jgi:flagellin
MGLRIATNVSSLATQRAMSTTSRDTERALKQLATGNRFVDVSEGAADFAIGEHIRAQSKGMQAAKNNADAALSFLQVAEGGLNEQNNLLIRMRELAIQAASDTYSDDERGMADLEYQQLTKEVDRIANSTSYGSQKVLAGQDKEYQFQVGAYKGDDNVIKYNSNTNTTVSAMELDGLDVQTQDNALDTLEKIDSALTTIGKARASFGAIQSRMNSVINSTEDQVLALETARSRIQDVDVAQAYSNVQKGQILQQYQIAALTEANKSTGNVIRLIG